MKIEPITAKTKTCPILPLRPHDNYDRDCKGSECMAWRWLSDGKISGYCGIAGRPLEVEKTLMRNVADELKKQLGIKKETRSSKKAKVSP